MKTGKDFNRSIIVSGNLFIGYDSYDEEASYTRYYGFLEDIFIEIEKAFVSHLNRTYVQVRANSPLPLRVKEEIQKHFPEVLIRF